MSKSYFAGANTPGGFYGFYENILPFGRTNRKIYIKGGSGTGKSGLIKRTAEFFAERGFGENTEYFYCSNDAESLDGVSIPELGIAAVDATSPHPADPQLPAAIDGIFNAAGFLDETYIKSKKELLVQLYAGKKVLYGRAYSYLRAAGEIYGQNENLYASAVNKTALNELIIGLLKIFGEVKPSKREAADRRLFATAITPEGVKSLTESALKAERIYVLQGAGAMGIYELLETLQKNANLLGLDTVSFKSPLNPEKTEHLYIKMHENDIAFTTSNRYHEFKAECTERIDFWEFVNKSILAESEINYNNEIFGELLQKGIGVMAASKELHIKTEEIYSEGMDFKRMHRAFNAVLEQIKD